MLSKLRQHPAATIFVVALTLRLVAALAITWYCARAGRGFLIEGDANGYWELASKIVDGEEYVIGGRYALRMPGFPALLAMSQALLGNDIGLARIVISIVGAVGCVAVFFLGRLLVSERVGWLGGLWTAVSPTLVGFTPLILTEAVFATALTISIVLLHFTHQQLHCRHVSWPFAISTGAAVALATYIRPTWLLAGPAFAVCLWLKHRNAASLRTGVLICLTMFVALLPWAMRNQSVTNHFVLTTLWMGPSLYDGLHERATGESDMTFVETDGLMMKLGEYKANQHYRDEAIAFAKQNPGRVIDLGFRKLGRFWNPLPNAAQFQSLIPRVACLVGFFPLMLLSIRGAWMQRGNLWTLAMCLSPIIYFSMLHFVFVGSLRYRLPAEYPLSVLAACGLSKTSSS